jgi:acyl-CoA thioester hydrolase
MADHVLDIRIYYEDTDFSGFVYHAAYLKFFERGRTEFLRSRGIHHSALADASGLAFAVRSMSLEFLGAARIDDLVRVETHIESVSGVRLTLAQRVVREQVTLTTARVLVVPVRIGGGAARLPPELRDRLTPD